MAGDWIKMRAALCTHPKVLLIASIVGESTDIGRRLSTGFNGSLDEIVTSDVTRDVTLASLLRVWCATNEHTSDGVWFNSTLKTLDHAAGIPGFGEAMALAGWAIYDEERGTVTLPNFLENNAPAKGNSRSTSAERQARYREKRAKSNALCDVTSNVTRDVTSNAREEKRREDISSSLRSEDKAPKKRLTPPKPEEVDSQVWADWLQLRKDKKAPVTETVLRGAQSEADKAGISLDAFLRVWCTRGSQGLQADWLKPNERQAPNVKPSRQSALEAHNAAVAAKFLETFHAND